MTDRFKPRLRRLTPVGDVCPVYEVTVDGIVVGEVGRYSHARAKRGRWVNQPGLAVDTFWEATRDGGTRSGFLTRASAVAHLGIHRQESTDTERES